VLKQAPFTFDALRPFVSVTLHRIRVGKEESYKEPPASEQIAVELSKTLEDFLAIDDGNRFGVDTNAKSYGVIETKSEEDLALTGIWFKRSSAPTWLDAKLGPAGVQDVINHILIVAVKSPYLAVLGTHDKTRDEMSRCLAHGDCGRRLSFVAPPIDRTTLERSFVRGETRVSWLTGLHAHVLTKPDSKTLQGRDLRYAIDPFADQSFTYTSAISILPELQHREIKRRRVTYAFANESTKRKYERYAFRVGVTPEEHKVWTVPTKEFKHLQEELSVLFDTLELPAKPELIQPWGHNQDGLKFLAQPIPAKHLTDVRHAFDVGLDLSSPPQAGNTISPGTDVELYREKWRAFGRLEVKHADPNSANFTALVLYNEEVMAEIDVTPREASDDLVKLRVRLRTPNFYLEGVECFEYLFYSNGPEKLTVRYDSNHVISGLNDTACPLFLLRWQDVLFNSWEWPFTPKRGKHIYDACEEKPRSQSKKSELPDREKAQGWEKKLGEFEGKGSLFDYLVINAEEIFKPEGEWHLCCDDGPGEVADFIYFEPKKGRLYLIHIKGAHGSKSQNKEKEADKPLTKGKKGQPSGRQLSVKVYEEVVSQATKNLRYLDPANLLQLLRPTQSQIDQHKQLPIWETCFHNGTRINRVKILKALDDYKGARLLDKRVIVFQPHVRRKRWKEAEKHWLDNQPAEPKNEINRFLQLRTLLADAEITCRKIGITFEVWGEDDGDSKKG
jgi:hypothetical protein